MCWIRGFSTPPIQSLITSSWSCKRSSSMRDHCYIYGSSKIQIYDNFCPADPKICLDKCGPDMRISGRSSGWRSSHLEAANAASRWEFIVKSLDPLGFKDSAFFIQQIPRSVWIKETGWLSPISSYFVCFSAPDGWKSSFFARKHLIMLFDLR